MLPKVKRSRNPVLVVAGTCLAWLGRTNERHHLLLRIRHAVVIDQPWECSGSEYYHFVGYWRIAFLVHRIDQLHHNQASAQRAILASALESWAFRHAYQYLFGPVLDSVSKYSKSEVDTEQLTNIGYSS